MQAQQPPSPSRIRYTETFSTLPPHQQDEHLQRLALWLLSRVTDVPPTLRRHRLQRKQQLRNTV